jgi:hypothetical protein
MVILMSVVLLFVYPQPDPNAMQVIIVYFTRGILSCYVRSLTPKEEHKSYTSSVSLRRDNKLGKKEVRKKTLDAGARIYKCMECIGQ